MEPLASKDENAEKAEEFVEPPEANAPVTQNLQAEESKYETAL